MPQTATPLKRVIGFRSAIGLVVGTIIGTGIFTSTGFQAADLGHPGYIFMLWIVGGILSLFGALCYCELGAAMPRSGGEYAYLRETYGPEFGFMSAVVSLTAGFSAPAAIMLKSFIQYASHFWPALGDDRLLVAGIRLPDLLAVLLAWGLVAIHLRGTRGSYGFNDLFTGIKVVGLILIIIAAALLGRGNLEHFTQVAPAFHNLGPADRTGAFATALIYVMFCYSGWNAAAYVAGEMVEPQRHLPRALLAGTALVMVLYLAMNAVYLYGANVEELAGKVEVGLVAARHLFGPAGTSLVTLVILVALLSAASSLTLAGPRVYYAMGRDSYFFRWLGNTRPDTGAPHQALWLQGVFTTFFILTGRVDQILQYVGFTLTLFSCLAVSCVFVLRVRRPNLVRPFRTWGYPFTPAMFLVISGWMLLWNFRERPAESVWGLATIILSGGMYHLLARRKGG